MSIENPQYWYFFLAALVLVAAQFWYRRWWLGAKKRLGQSRHFTYLGKALNFTYAPGNIVLIILCTLLLALALLNPRKPDRKGGSSAVQGMDIAIALDVSNSMLAADLPPSRLQQATLLLGRLMDTLQNNRVSFIAFAGNAYLQMPLTTDMQAAASIIESVSPKMVPLQGTNLSNALEVAGQSFDPAQTNYKAVILISDGETHDEQSEAAAQQLRDEGVMLINIGIGSPDGVLLADENNFPFRDPETGEQVVSALNETLLKDLAAITSGEYHRFSNAEETLSAILTDLDGMDKKPISNMAMMNYTSYAFIPLTVVLLLLLWQTIRGRQGKKKLAITSILLLPVLCSFGQQGDVNKARDLYQKGKFAEASQKLSAVLGKTPDNEVANFYQGNIYFRQNQFEEAAAYFEKSRQYLQDNREKANAANNLGLALANNEKLDEAIDALKQALRNNPYDSDIQHNLNVALNKKKQQQPPPPQKQPPPPPKNKKQQNENKLDALEQEEKKIRERQMDKQQTSNPGKNW